MPREPEISPDYLLVHLKKWPIFEKGHLKPEKSPVWGDIRRSLDLKMTTKSLFLYVYNNRHNSLTELKKFYKIRKKVMNDKIKERDADYDPDDNPFNPHNCDELNFVIVISVDKIVKSNDDRKKKEGWTDQLRCAIWQSQNLPCPFRLNGYITKEKFIFNGDCSDCGTGISGCGFLNNKDLNLHVKTFAIHAIPHTKKIKLAGQQRKEVKRILLTKTASDYKEEELEKISTEYEPPFLNNSHIYRKAREEALNEDLGYNIYKNLSITNKSFINKCFIKKLSLNPLCVMYWSREQIELWNILQDKMLPLSFDSTGGMIKKYAFYDNIKNKTIYYYVLVIGVSNKIVPLLQAILSIHHVPVIEEVLNRWLESGAKIPKEITTDGSLALQNAICLAFNKMTYASYNLNCYLRLINDTAKLPACYYRCDVAHLLRTIKKWKCMKSLDENSVNFYIRSVGYLTQVNSLDEFINIVTSVVVIANSALSEENSECYCRKRLLMELFKTYKYDSDEFIVSDKRFVSSKNDLFPIEKNNQNIQIDNNELITFVTKLFQNALSLCSQDDKISDQINVYYCPEFTKSFQVLCYSFVSWTNVMKNHYNSPNSAGSSSRSEAYFKRKKEQVPSGISLPKFILKDCKKINALTKYGLLKSQSQSHIEIKEQDLVLNLNQLNLIPLECPLDITALSEWEICIDENNYPINIDANKHSSTPISTSDISILNNDIFDISCLVNTSIGHNRNLVINGSIVGYHEYNISGELFKICFLNTCPFDSIFEALVAVYHQSSIFKSNIENYRIKNGVGIFNAVIEYLRNPLKIYQMRAEIQYPIYRHSKYSHGYCIDCRENVTNAFTMYMTPLACIKKNLKCSICHFNNETLFYMTSLSSTEMYDIGLDNLELTLNNKFANKKVECENCLTKSINVTFDYINGYLAIDLEYLHEEKNKKLLKNTVKKRLHFRTKFSNLQLQINLQKRLYQLISIICFEGDTCENNEIPVHYKTFILQLNGKWILYDGLLKTIQLLDEDPAEKIAILIYAEV